MILEASVVVACHADKRVIRLVDALGRQTMARESFEIIVVENGTTLLSPSDFSTNVVYERISAPNMAAARNRGLALARGQYVLLTDADCVPADDWVHECTSALTSGAAAVGGLIERHCPQTPVQKHGSNIVNGQRSLNFLPILALPYVVGANSAFRRDLLLSCGGFDEDLKSGNDVDVCYKLGLLGHAISHAPRAVVFHDNRRGIWEHFLRFHRYALYHAALFKKYRHAAGRAAILNPYPCDLLCRSLRALPLACVQLSKGEAGPLWAAGLDIVEGLGVACGNIHGSLRYRVLYI